MHDFMLAKEIIDKILEVAGKRELENIKSVSLEIGSVTLAHDDLPEHTEDVSLENLEFGLKNISKNTILENSKFSLKKIGGENWKITNIETE